MSLIPTWPALIAYETAFNVGPNGMAVPPLWTDISARTTFAQGVQRGRQYELDTNPAGEWRVPLDNRDGALDPSNTASPYAPNVVPYRPCRIRCRLGVNQLTADQATAGQDSVIPAGTSGTALKALLGVSNDFGYTVSLASSGSAYTGSQVYQVTVPGGSTANTTILLLTPVPVVPGQWYSATAQVRIPSGSTVTCNTAIFYYTSAGTQVSATGGTAVSLTAGSSSWTTLTVSAQAPTGSSAAYYATIKVEITASVGANTVFQVGALQWEQSQTATPWQTPQSLPANLLPQQIATGTQGISAISDSASNYFYAEIGTIAQAQFLTAAPSGQSTALAWTIPSGTGAASFRLYVGGGSGTIVSSGAGPIADCVQVTASTVYTASAYLSRLASADATVQMLVGYRWFDAGGNLISTSAGTAVTVPTSGWVRATCTATAPAGAVWGRARTYFTSPATTTATNVIYVTGWQVEAAGSASTWMDPGPTQFIFTGYFERFPQTWLMAGTYGQVGAIGVDAEAVIAQDTLRSPFVEEVMAMSPGPSFFYQLADPAGSSTVVDTAARRPAAPIENSPAGPGSVTLGSSVTSTTTAGGVLGTSGTCAAFSNNPNGTGSSVQLNETFASLHKTTVSPGPPSNGSWTRIVHFEASTAPANSTQAFAIWEALPATYQPNLSSAFDVAIRYPNVLVVALSGNNGVVWDYIGTASVCDGNWHQVVVCCDGSGNITVYLDGSSIATGSITLPLSGIASDVLGASVQIGANYYRAGMVGSIAGAIEFPYVLSATQVTNLYQSWRNASAGESSGARIQRVLTWTGYQGKTAIDAGSTTNMGPASDLAGATGLDACNSVALTENGNFYVSAAGAVTFTARSRRYNQAVPVFIFGENAAAGEWPYESIGLDFDPTHLFNDIQVTQYSTSQVAEAIDSTSETSFLERVLQRTTNQGNFTETTDAAAYLLQQYKTPRTRISDLTLHPAAMPGLWRVCMNLEIGTRIRVMRRPPNAPAIAVDCFTESITWDVDPDTGEAVVHLQCSPADKSQYWNLAALHTTLNAQAASGQNQATINALPDAAVNPLASSLPTAYQLVFEPGTARQETMTLAAGGIPSTSPGYATAALTFTTNFGFTHPSGSTVCEVLPTGYTDPTTWDLSSILGALGTTLNAAAASGASVITVNALPDAKTNALGSNWNTGDTIVLSPGTANVETATIRSVAATVPGYSTCQITLAANLAHSHAVGDTVCDPLPTGVTSVAEASGTARLTY